MTKEEYNILIKLLTSLLEERGFDALTVEEIKVLGIVLKQVRTQSFKAIKEKLHAQ